MTTEELQAMRRRREYLSDGDSHEIVLAVDAALVAQARIAVLEAQLHELYECRLEPDKLLVKIERYEWERKRRALLAPSAPARCIWWVWQIPMRPGWDTSCGYGHSGAERPNACPYCLKPIELAGGEK